ncbi:hypothetical protein GGX14DRAFT_326244, partial [Mycena pura]
GSFEDDFNNKEKFSLIWDSMDDFNLWLAAEQKTNSIELLLIKTTTRQPIYDFKYRYVCSRGNTGGIEQYKKKLPDRLRRLPPKRTDCQCALTVKRYPGTSIMLGAYSNVHNHSLNHGNVAFTRIPKATREFIAAQLRNKMGSGAVVRYLALCLQKATNH